MKFLIEAVDLKKEYSSTEFSALPENDMVALIGKGAGSYSKHQEYITIYLQSVLGGNYSKIDQNGMTVIVNNLVQMGAKGNALVPFLKEYTNSAGKVTYDIAATIHNAVGSGLINTKNVAKSASPYLYNESLYTEPIEENIFKIKAFVLTSDPKEIKKWKFDDKVQESFYNGDGTIKTGAEIQDILNNYTRNVEDAVLLDGFKQADANFETYNAKKQQAFIKANYISSGGDRKALEQALEEIYADKNLLIDFFNEPIQGTDAKLVKTVVNRFLKAYIDSRTDASDTKVTVLQYLQSKRAKFDTLSVADKVEYIVKKVLKNPSDASNIESVLTQIFNNTKGTQAFYNIVLTKSDDAFVKKFLLDYLRDLVDATKAPKEGVLSGSDILKNVTGRKNLTAKVVYSYVCKVAKKMGYTNMDVATMKDKYFTDLVTRDEIDTPMNKILQKKYNAADVKSMTEEKLFNQDIAQYVQRIYKRVI